MIGDIILLSFGIICLFIGFIGCIIPALPGPPLSYVGLLLLEWSAYADFSMQLLLILAAVVAVVTLLDFIAPIYMTKVFGGTRWGTWGSTIGLLIGMIFFNIAGVIIGPFLGALIGELLGGKRSNHALKSAFGSFIGFIFGTGAKLVSCGLITFYFIQGLFGGA